MSLKIKLLILVFALPLFLAAQQPDTETIRQEVAVMQRMLDEMLQVSGISADFPEVVFGENESSSYVPGFGVVFKTQRSGGIRVWQVAPENPAKKGFSYSFNMADSINGANETKLISQFLKDYGDLAYWLKPDEKVMVVVEAQEDEYSAWSPGESFTIRPSGDIENEEGDVIAIARSGSVSVGGSPHLSISVTKKLLDEHRQGKLTEKDLYSKMVVERSKEAAGNDTQFKVFEAAISQKLALLTPKLRPEQDSSVMILWAPDMYPSPESGTSYVPGFGLTLQLNVEAPYDIAYAPQVISLSGRGSRKDVVALAPQRDDDQAPDPQVDAWQKAAKESLRTSIVVYGRTLRSLKEEELLRVILNSPRCESCMAPARTIFTVKAGVLKAYDAGTLALPGALNEVQIVTEGKASYKE